MSKPSEEKSSDMNTNKKAPLCANILLYKLDCYIKNILMPKYIIGDINLRLLKYLFEQELW
jgi:hypothetical protein